MMEKSAETTKNRTAQQSGDQLESIDENETKDSEIDDAPIQEQQPPSSPILVRKTSRAAQDTIQTRINTQTPRGVTFTASTVNFTPTHLTNYANDEDSFTKVTRQAFDFTNKADETHMTPQYNLAKDKNVSQETSMNIDESELDFILFSGLNLNNKARVNDDNYDKFFGMPEKTQTNVIKKLKSRSASAGHRINGPRKSPKDRVLINKSKKRSSSANNRKYFPDQNRRTFNMFHLELTTRQLNVMNQIIRQMNESQEESSDSQVITCYMNKKYTQNTTHIMIDFNNFFDPNIIHSKLNLNKKCLLILAAVNECKIIRFEWLKHSWKKSEWLEELDFLVESYLESEIDAYDEADDFDVKLIRLVRNLKNKKCSQFFSSFKNIYIMEQREDCNEDVCSTANATKSRIDEDAVDESGLDLTGTMLEKSAFFEATNLSLNIFKNKNSTYDYLIEILTKCGAHLTSRVQHAELIIAIDRTQDFSQDVDKFQAEIESERVHFTETIQEMQKLVRKKEGVQVISSDWILGIFISIFFDI
jgi:hypothetical protein